MDQEDKIIVFSVCDNHYVILLAALLKSIEVHHKTTEIIDFYIIEDNISSDNKAKINLTVDSAKISINWIKIIDFIPRKVRLPLDHSSFPLNIYARLFIPQFVHESVQKVLYLDVDMLMLNDISVLWETDLSDAIEAGVVDRPETVSNSWGAVANYQELGLDPATKYFNSGLLLLNPIKWRESDITPKVMSAVNNNVQFANYPDQYGLNVVFANQWLELDPKWNCHSTSTISDPYLIHFSGRKPIYKSYNHNLEYLNLFEQHISQTPWNGYKKIGEVKRLAKKLYNKLEKYVSLNF